MLSICATCSAKTPRLSPLSDDHRQLLHTILNPVVNITDLKAYPLQICKNCNLLIDGVENFQRTARRGIRAFKSLLASQTPIVQTAYFIPLLEAKPEPITVKTDPENDFSTIKQQFISVPASNENPVSEEIVIKIEPNSKPDYSDSDSTVSAEMPVLMSPDSLPFVVSSGSDIIQNMMNNVVPFVQDTNVVYQVTEQDSEQGGRVPKKYVRKKLDLLCPHCNKTYKGRDSLRDHIQKFHLDLKPSPCGTCGKSYRNEISLKQHIQTSHEQPKKTRTIDDINPDLFCAKCEIHFETRTLLKKHTMSLKHTPREHYAFECETCNKRFPTSARRREHIELIHLKKKRFKCEICGMEFCRATRVREHVRRAHEMQEKQRKHVCHLCGKSFSISKSLQEHLLVHEGLRPLKCQLCPATFSYKAALFNHNRLKHLKMKLKKKQKKTAGLEDTGKSEGKKKLKKKGRKVEKAESGVEKEEVMEVQIELEEVIQTNEVDINTYFNKTM